MGNKTTAVMRKHRTRKRKPPLYTQRFVDRFKRIISDQYKTVKFACNQILELNAEIKSFKAQAEVDQVNLERMSDSLTRCNDRVSMLQGLYNEEKLEKEQAQRSRVETEKKLDAMIIRFSEIIDCVGNRHVPGTVIDRINHLHKEISPEIKSLKAQAQNYNEKYKRACQERDGFREQMLTAQEQERRVGKQSAEMQADFTEYKDAVNMEMKRLAVLISDNKTLRETLASLRCVEKQAAELTTRNQELVAAGRVMEDSIKNQAARLRLAESENDRLRRVAIEIKRKTSIVITVLIVLVSVVVLGGLML